MEQYESDVAQKSKDLFPKGNNANKRTNVNTLIVLDGPMIAAIDFSDCHVLSSVIHR